MKNLDPRDINVRIERIQGVTGPKLVAHQKPSPLSYVSHSFGLENALTYPTSPSAFGISTPTHYQTTPSAAPLITDGPIKPSYVDNYFSSIKQPYRYEPVGVINKSIRNPFTALNTGENLAKGRLHLAQFPHRQHSATTSILQHIRPIDVDPRSKYEILDDHSYLTKLSPSFNDFNGLRHAKSISVNSTVAH